MHLLAWSAWSYFWPLFLILAGLWFFLRPAFGRGEVETTSLAIPRENSGEASVEFNHGAGTLTVGADPAAGNLLDGTFGGGVSHSLDRYGSTARIKLNAETEHFWWNWFPPDGFRWNVRLTRDCPLELVFHTGAGESKIDLSALQVRKLTLETGASSTHIVLPAQAGQTSVDVHAGAAAVVLRVPQGVAGRIHVRSGLIGLKIDPARFPHNGSTYESPDYLTAANKVEITVEAGAGSIEITGV
jgi:hypothetical protein